ncbi:alpha/beta hydrolase (plasmid) [Streptomyces sp. NBC_01450]|nr:alpha/beta hydrolase [Streptomyces sp. NBC_01450]
MTHPFGAVKEQVPTTYAKLLAEQGLITLVFDASYQGESGGEPHFSEFPSTRVEDIRRAVDFLSIHPDVDKERIGALGICAGGSYTVNVSQTEMRIKAVAGVSTFNIGSARRAGDGPLGKQSAEYRTEISVPQNPGDDRLRSGYSAASGIPDRSDPSSAG